MHIDIACDIGYRPMVVNDKGNRFCLVLLGKATACRAHSFFSRLNRAANPCVHQTGNGPELTSYIVTFTILGVTHGGTQDSAEVAFTSVQDPGAGGHQQDCSNWKMT